MHPILDKGLRPSPIDARDRVAALPIYSGPLPRSVDLMPHVTEVEDQGSFNSCTANAGCSALELMYQKAGHTLDLSRFFLYYYTRFLGGIRGDEGAYPRDIGKALHRYGVCYEPTWDYLPHLVNAEPSAAAQTEAVPFKILSYEQLFGDKLFQARNAVAQGIPILSMIEVHEGFYYLNSDWKTHNWNTVTSDTNPMLGYHEVLIIGYDDVAERLLVQNSWGPNWGDGGFFGIPYSKINTSMYKETWVLNPNYEFNSEPVIVEPEKTIPPIDNDNETVNITAIVALIVVGLIALLFI